MGGGNKYNSNSFNKGGNFNKGCDDSSDVYGYGSGSRGFSCKKGGGHCDNGAYKAFDSAFNSQNVDNDAEKHQAKCVNNSDDYTNCDDASSEHEQCASAARANSNDNYNQSSGNKEQKNQRRFQQKDGCDKDDFSRHEVKKSNKCHEVHVSRHRNSEENSTKCDRNDVDKRCYDNECADHNSNNSRCANKSHDSRDANCFNHGSNRNFINAQNDCRRDNHKCSQCNTCSRCGNRYNDNDWHNSRNSGHSANCQCNSCRNSHRSWGSGCNFCGGSGCSFCSRPQPRCKPVFRGCGRCGGSGCSSCRGGGHGGGHGGNYGGNYGGNFGNFGGNFSSGGRYGGWGGGCNNCGGRGCFQCF